MAAILPAFSLVPGPETGRDDVRSLAFLAEPKPALRHKVVDLFFAELVRLTKNRGCVSDQHFSVDATLIEAWASLNSFKPQSHDSNGGHSDGNGWADFKGEKRRSQTHASTTDSGAKLVHKGNTVRQTRLHRARRNGEPRWVGCVCCTREGPRDGFDAEVTELLQRGITPRTLAADRVYCSRNFIEHLHRHRVVPHPAPMK